MANASLEELRPSLEAIPAHEIDEPDLPMAVALQEAHDLAALVGEAEVRDSILAVGLDAAKAGVDPILRTSSEVR